MTLEESKEPNKGQGVPRDTRDQNCLQAVACCLQQCFSELDWSGMAEELEQRQYFEAGVIEQVEILAQWLIQRLHGSGSVDSISQKLLDLNMDKMDEILTCMIPLWHPDLLPKQIAQLLVTGTRPGTGARELSQMKIHLLTNQHGFNTIWPLIGQWVHSENEYQRRLVAEALRPRGVWMAHITELRKDPTPLKKVLEPLLDDPADYVRKAVANNLNDISKDHPDLVLDWCAVWQQAPLSKQRQWILSRGLRTLTKQGHPRALELQGFSPASQFDIQWVGSWLERLQINQYIQAQFRLTNQSGSVSSVLLMMHLQEPSKGSKPRLSQYQIWKGTLNSDQTSTIEKRIHFIHRNSRPKLPGEYVARFYLNGSEVEVKSFVYEG